MSTEFQTKIGIIGGSGLYSMDTLEHIQNIAITNCYGSTSAPISHCRMKGVEAELYFLPRHGNGHHLSPSEVPYQANILAMKELGVQWIFSVSAVGSLKEEIAPGDMVVIDQFIDRTKARPSTFFHDGIIAHVAFGDPVCSTLRKILLESTKECTEKYHDGGTYVCMEGPAFSTRAESNMYRSWGASVIGMTNLPEAKLAREAEISYATLAMSTDYDCWHLEHDDVTVEQVIAIMKQNVVLAKEILNKAIPKVAELGNTSPFAGSLSNAIITNKDVIPAKRKEELSAILGSFLS